MSVKISSIIENQFPEFMRQESPLLVEFIKQYYISGEYPGASFDLISNLSNHTKLQNLTNLVENTTLSADISFSDTDILVESTDGFPISYGLLKIGSEIITYTSKTETSFVDCVRGFSGISNSQLEFSASVSDSHLSGEVVENLSILFLNKFLDKLKKQYIPGFEGREFGSNVNQKLFIEKSKDFYSVKGTDKSFEILFGALYGEKVEVIKPRDYLFTPSAAEYRVTKDIFVEAILGDPLLLENRTLFQDRTDQYPKASGSISKVEKISRNGSDYYIISLDYDFNKDIDVAGSVFGEFSIHPKTRISKKVIAGSNAISVDSTVGFPYSGFLVLDDYSLIQYESKSLTQFFDCSGILSDLEAGESVRVDAFAYGYSGSDKNNIVAVRVTGVIGEFEEIDSAYNLIVGDSIKPKTLGKLSSSVRSKNWIYNIPISYYVESITLIDAITSKYQIKTFDDNIFSVGDSLNIILTNGTIITTDVYSKLNVTNFIVQGQGVLTLSSIDYIEKNISNVSASNFKNVEIYSANVQNVYEDLNESVFVASPSLPFYFQQPLEVSNRKIVLSGTFSGEILNYTNHGFLSGDIVLYDYPSVNNLGIPKGTYYIKKVNDDFFSLATSLSNLKAESYLTVSGTVNNNTLEYNDFTGKTLTNQKIIRKITQPINRKTVETTPVGNIGILLNGVEILNYKSQNSVYYGPIVSAVVVSSGDGYDINNPPTINIIDERGSGAKLTPEIVGDLKEIRLNNSNLIVIGEPSITITGGNGTGAKAEPEIGNFEHFATFNTKNIFGNIIKFTDCHNFFNYEKVLFVPDGYSYVTGITTNAEYYVSRVSPNEVKLYKTYDDSVSDLNTINLNVTGFGIHRLVSFSPKLKISSIVVTNPGKGYTNRRISVDSSAINIITDTINFPGHGFKTGELINYESYSQSPIVGIQTNTSYYATEVDENNFKLSQVASVGILTSKDFYLTSQQYINFSSSGIGKHFFNYEPIKVTIEGVIDLCSTPTPELPPANPIFRGRINRVFVEGGGQNYGQENIINYNRQPNISINSGKDATLQVIISNGKITEVLIINSGSGYNSPPDIIISGNGNGAVLTPIIADGELKSVNIINSGYGYEQKNTSLTVVSAGSNAEIRTNTKSWSINWNERLIQTNQITADDGLITRGTRSDLGLEYVHGYAPRKLRQMLQGVKYVSNNPTYRPDLTLDSYNRETISDSHSPIIGWAYDGNPIYGPYGYEHKTSGRVKLLQSSYGLSLKEGRPNTTLYSAGIFIEDYEFNNSGDLDEHNGRYCITPDFPNGTYAYFATVSDQGVENSGPFKDYFRPVFPYLIGESYKSKPITFNFDYYSNQDTIDLNKTGWLRNTTPFRLKSEKSFYKYLLSPFNTYDHSSTVTSTLTGSVEEVLVTDGGDGYKVKDKLIFDSETSGGINASAEVSSVKGKDVNIISVGSTTIFNVEFIPNSSNNVIGFSSLPHNISNGDIVSIKNLSHNKLNLQKSFRASVSSQKYTLNTDVNVSGITGIVTYINLYGNLDFPYLRENDILQIDNENVKVLNIDTQSSRLFVERAYGGTAGTYHTVGVTIKEVPRKFSFSAEIQDFNNSFINKEIYFNPEECVGIGLGKTITFSTPGVGLTNIFVPSRSIYIPDHNLKTGEKLTYKINGGTEITISTNGITTSLLKDNTTVYAVRYSSDFVGLSTEKVGVGATGNFVGYNTTSGANILYFNVNGTGKKHSIITSYDSTIGQVDKNLVSVFPKTSSELNVGDLITVSATPNSTKNIKIIYNQATQRLLVNPREFLATDVNIIYGTIKIPNHNYFTGQKILHTSLVPTTGLISNTSYYVIVLNSNVISLSSSYYNASLSEPNIISLSNASYGTISEVNPSINIVKNNSAIFDLSDSSLSDNDGFQLVPAFDFDFYTDKQFINKFETTFSGPSFNVIKSGRIGVDLDATVTLNYDENLPNQLFYKLTPRKNKQVIIDEENTSKYNTLNYVDSGYSGTYAISGVGSTSFTYSVDATPEAAVYTNNVTYTTTSKTTTGPVNTIRVTSGGSNYKFLPGISSVITNQGRNAIFEVVSKSIGSVNRVNINNIGFDYPADLTLTPSTQTPVVIIVAPQTSLKTISVVSTGRNYIFAPTLVLLDGLTLKPVPGVDLRYQLGDSEVQIIKNSKGINNAQPIIIPTNNSNAIGISSISFNETTKDVAIVLTTSYSNIEDFPFAIGDKVLVENVSILTDSSAKGYNSSSYDYSRFTITSISPNIGGSNGSITYNLANKLSDTEYPGVYNSTVSSGSVVPEKFFPQFITELSKNLFLIGEVVTADNLKGIVQFWNSDNELLTISTTDQFTPGQLIIGSDSRSGGKISTVYDFNSRYIIKSSSIVKKGWNTEKGFLDNEFQRIQDNNYYNSFAYSLKSKVDYQTWNNAVSSLNHISGFKKFSDLVVESENIIGTGSSETESLTNIIIFNDSEVNLNCVEDYDLVTENNYLIDSNLGSNQVYFNNRILQDYSETVGNRVLTIDDISLGFDGFNKQFDLKYNSDPIFNRSFVGSNSSVVNVASNVLQLENHFFTNGEKLAYSYDVSPIGIKTTSISGIGSTDKLPSTVYVIKYSESAIGLSTSAESALRDIPVPIILTNVGAGLTHTLTATSQNTRALISLGGAIQSPVVSSASSTKTTSYVGIGSTVILFSSIENFSSGDFAKINSEIVKVVAVGIASTNDVSVQRGWVGTGIETHSTNSTVYKILGDYNIINNTIHFVDPPKGPSPIGTTTGSGEDVDYVGVTTTLDFNGRVFMRSGAKNSTVDAYSTNFIFDDISNNFNGISSSFTLKSNYQNIAEFSPNNGAILINEVFQTPSDFAGSFRTYGSYTLEESSGITSIRFLGAPAAQTYDVNGTGLPIGGVIVSVGYSQGFGLQPLVAAGGTAVVSTAGTIRSISIGNSGSGYRSGLQTVNVGLYVSTTGISTVRYIGIASILNGNVVSVAITNPGFSYTSTNPPVVKFDDPLPYVDLPLQYQSLSSGIGTGGKVKINVGLGMSVVNLELTNRGFGYKKGDILTIGLGGTVGIPTITSPSYSNFRLSVDEIYNNKFAGWTFGELQIIDSIENLFNGLRKSFPIKIDNELRSIRARYGSPIDIKSTLLIFVNGILQIPGDGYNFTGSSFITFTEAPKEGYSCVVLFYRGTGSVDVVDVDVLESIKRGDTVKLNGDRGYSENERVVTSVNSSDSINTISYSGPGISEDETYTRPVKWCRQTEDLFIDQKEVPKTREIYEPIIEPSTNIIKTVGINSTTIFVENIRTFFDDQRENAIVDYRNKFKIITQDETRPAISTATVSIAGTIRSVTILDGGWGYISPPVVSFSNPIGLTTASRAYATATVSSGSISSITITTPGTGYTSSLPPQVMVSNPSSVFEDITASTIEGDFGIITGVATTSVGVASTGLVFNLYIPQESAMRNNSIVGAAVTISGIQTGYYFVLKNSFVGNGITSLDESGSIISIGSSFIDNVYRVADVSITQTFVTGVGTTSVSKVTVSITNNGITGIGFTGIYGTYSWGKITVLQRASSNEFTVYNNGLSGISTSPILKRVNPLKYKNYT
jgi:hypothetical protein